jgi:hypothetical protein
MSEKSVYTRNGDTRVTGMPIYIAYVLRYQAFGLKNVQIEQSAYG